MTYGEAVARLLALRGGERPGMRPGLDRIEALLDALGRPERSYRIVQVGGTNGKGSIAATLASIAEAAGRRTGLYTSPHLCSFRERIRVDGRAIAETEIVDGVEALGTLVARVDASVFEATTALALDHFARSAVSLAVLEVGLGGRLDATTVGRPEAEALGRIDHDHEAELGRTLTEIAGEKAAIIRSGVAVSARQEAAVERVVMAHAARAGIPLLLEGRELTVTIRRASLDGQWLDMTGPGWRLEDVRCSLLGAYQASNALVAAATAHCLDLPEAAIRAGLGRVCWPGRFQVLQRDPVMVLDGAHNPGGARALAVSLAAYFPGRPLTLVFGVSADKDAVAMLTALAPLAHRLVLTAAAHPRAAKPADLAAALDRTGIGVPGGVEVADTAAAALDRAVAGPGRSVVCVAGSLFLVGEVLALRGACPDILAGAPGATLIA